MGDLKGWLLDIREKSKQIGEIAFQRTERKRDGWRQLAENDPILASASFNSALERIQDEQDDCTSNCFDSSAFRVSRRFRSFMLSEKCT